MTLKKAIEILQLNIDEAGKTIPPDVKDALKLGVEALEFVIAWRKDTYHPQHPLLPGETED